MSFSHVWLNQSINQSIKIAQSTETSETQLRAIKTTEYYLLFLLLIKIFFQLIQAENIDLNVSDPISKNKIKKNSYGMTFKNVNSVSVNKNQTNKQKVM